MLTAPFDPWIWHVAELVFQTRKWCLAHGNLSLGYHFPLYPFLMRLPWGDSNHEPADCPPPALVNRGVLGHFGDDWSGAEYPRSDRGQRSVVAFLPPVRHADTHHYFWRCWRAGRIASPPQSHWLALLRDGVSERPEHVRGRLHSA